MTQRDYSNRTLCGCGAIIAANSMREVSVPLKSLLASVCILLIASALSLSGYAQGPIPPGIRQQETDERQRKLEEDLAKRANEQRQANIKKDTEKLFKLAGELKQYVDKTNEGILSIEVVKKAEEIEKLAHSVKEKMRTGY